MIELLLLKSLFNRDVYLSYRNYVSVSVDLVPILCSIDLWYRSNTTNPSVSDIAVSVPKGYPQEALNRLQSLDLPKDVLGLLRRVKVAQIASKLALEAHLLSEEEGSLQRVLDLSHELGTVEVAKAGEYVTDNIEEIISQTVRTPGLRWRLKWLNKSLGSMRRGDLGIIFARPETGKTSFLASEVTHMISQTKEPILWFNNEEQGGKVKLRCVQALLGATIQEVAGNSKQATLRYMSATEGRIKIVDDSGITAKKVESYVQKEKPALIVFDQIDKIQGFKSDREDLAMGAIYQWARELAKEYAPVLGVCQASGEAEGEAWLNMGHMSNAKTAKQAEADFIIGIGKVHGYDYIRYFNISKNKLLGDADTDPSMRHGRTEVLIKPEISRYEEA